MSFCTPTEEFWTFSIRIPDGSTSIVLKAASPGIVLRCCVQKTSDECMFTLHRYPVTMLYYWDEHADLTRFRSRPSTYSSMKLQVVEAFATFKSLSLQPGDDFRL
jgi:hypothetical protein